MTEISFILKVDKELLDKSFNAIYFNNQEINDESVFTMIKKGERIICRIDTLKPEYFEFQFNIDEISDIYQKEELKFLIQFNDKVCSIEINGIHLLDTTIQSL